MVTVFKSGSTALFTRATGWTIRLKEKAPFGMPRVIFISVNSEQIKLVAMAFINMLTVVATKASG